MAFQRVVRAEEVPPGQTRFFQLGPVPLVLANGQGRIYALHGLCPHQGNPLRDARLWDYLIACPWHQFQYDIRTG